MKNLKRIVSLMLVLTFALSCISISASSDNTNKNLLGNGGFERILTGWSQKLSGNSGVVTDTVYSGSRALAMYGGQNADQYLLGKMSSFDKAKSYEISAWVKADNLSDTGFYLAMLGVDANNNATAWYNVNEKDNQRVICSTSGTHGWKYISHIFDASVFDDTTTMWQFYLYMPADATGTVYVDDVAIREAYVNVYYKFNRFGNVLIQGDDMVMPVISKSTSASGKKINLSYTIFDDYNVMLANGTDSFIAPTGSYTYNMSLPVSDCGVYDMNLEISAADGSFCKSQNVRFAIAMQDNSDKLVDDLGLNTTCNRRYYHHAGPNDYYDAFKVLGTTWIRDEIRWENVETTKGVYKMPAKVAEMLDAIISNGQKGLIILGYGNTLYGHETIGMVPYTEEQMQGWKGYVEYVVQYIKDKGMSKDDIVFEVWNEYSGLANQNNIPASHYVNLVKTVKEAVDKIMPGVKITTEGMAGVIFNRGEERFGTYCETGALGYADYMGMHAYGMGLQPDDEDIFAEAVASFRSILNENGLADRPIFHSENGRTVHDGDAYGIYSEREAATYITRLYTLNKQMQKRYGQKDVLVVFSGAAQAYNELEDYGLFNLPWDDSGASSAKLTYVAYDAAASLLGGAEFVDSNEGDNLKIFRFKTAENQDMLVIWTADETQDISLDCGGTPVVYDMMGNVLENTVSNGKIRVTATREPLYIVGGTLSDLTVEEPELKISDCPETVYNGKYFKVMLSGNEALAGRSLEIDAKIPGNWEWVNSGSTFAADNENTLWFKIPDSDEDTMNRVVLEVSAGQDYLARYERFVEGATSEYDRNLVRNPSFEDSAEWSISDTSFAGIDKTIARTGQSSMKMTGKMLDGKTVNVRSPKPDIAVDRDEQYLISAWVKADKKSYIANAELVIHSKSVWKPVLSFKPDTEWKYYSAVIDFAETPVDEEFNFCVSLPDVYNGSIWVDDVELRKLRTPVGYASYEMLPDPNMELGADGWIDGWETLDGGKPIEYTTDEAHSGKQSIYASERAWFTSPRYEFDKEKVYEFTVWLKGTGRYFIGVPCYDENGNALPDYAGWSSPQYGPNYATEDAVSYSDWQKLTFRISAGGLVPDETKYFSISFRVWPNAGNGDTSNIKFWVDDASLTCYDVKKAPDVSGMVNPNATLGIDYWWELINASYDYSEYHSAPLSAKTEYNGSGGIALREKFDSPYKLEAGKTYEYSVWVKTDVQSDVGVKMVMNTRDKYSELLRIYPTTEWTQYKVYFKPEDVDTKVLNEPNKTYWRAVFEPIKDGTPCNIWVDDVVIREISEDMQITFAKAESTDVSGRIFRQNQNGAEFVAAVYEGDILKDCIAVNKAALEVGYNDVDFVLNNALESGDTLKVFVFDSVKNLKPLGKAAEKIIN